MEWKHSLLPDGHALDSDDADLGSEKINKVSRYFSLKDAKAEFLLDACT